MPPKTSCSNFWIKNIGMTNFLRKILVAVLVTALSTSLSFGAGKTFALPGFTDSFRITTERNQPGGVAMVRDPLDQDNTAKVFKFSIKPGPCVLDDCEQQSVRATVEQRPGAKQPDEAWYGWDMYLAPGFPASAQEARKHQTLAEFKDQKQCMLVSLDTTPDNDDNFLTWSMEKPTGKKMTQSGGDCIDLFDLKIVFGDHDS